MNDASKEEILEAINKFSSDTEERFDRLEGRIVKLEWRVVKIEGRVVGIEWAMATKADLGKFKLDMIDYLDRKFAEFRGEVILLLRKMNTKLTELVTCLKSRKTISEAEAKRLMAMEPFPQR